MSVQIYVKKEEIIDIGVKNYQKFIKEHFDIESIIEKIMLHGIDCKCYEMDRYFQGEEYAAKYIHALDMLTNFKYNLKEKAIIKYAAEYDNFLDEINQLYK